MITELDIYVALGVAAVFLIFLVRFAISLYKFKSS